MTEPKLCRNCKHYRRDSLLTFFSDKYDKCMRPIPHVSLITGKRQIPHLYCEMERTGQSVCGTPCGENAHYWEAK